MSEKILRVGVYGVKRGLSHIKNIGFHDCAKVVAVCDWDAEAMEKALPMCPPDVKVCPDYDALLAENLDLVVLANYLPDHAKCAIQALRQGVNVVSECLAAATLKECVELVEAVEETGMYYSMAENTPYDTTNLELQRLLQSGELGELSYAEAEYNHPSAPAKAFQYSPTADHWRRTQPISYYVTHPLGAMMNITRLMPKKVFCKVTNNYEYAQARNARSADNGALIMIEMEGGKIIRVTGCTSFSAHVNWSRVVGAKANAEMVRHDIQKISLTYNEWDAPEDGNERSVYLPPEGKVVKEAKAKGWNFQGHGMADFRCVHNYITELVEGKAPDMDVYRSTAMSAVALLAWRSALEGKEFEIPDFKDPAARDQYRNDDLSPWRGEIPWSIYPPAKPE